MRIPRLLGRIFALSLQRELAHRTNLLFEALMTTIGLAAGLTAISIVFSQTTTLAGWRVDEVIVLLGMYQVVSGLVQTFVEPNLSWFGGKVLRGELDDLILQPAPSLFMASLGTCQPWSLAQVGLGMLVVAGGIARLQLTPTPAAIIAALLLLLAGAVVTWSSRVLLASLAFWAPGLELDVMYGAFWQLGRYPVGVYHPAVRAVLLSVVPVAFVATLPARALTTGADPLLLLQGLVVAAISVWLTLAAWNAGLRRYTSATS